MGELRCGTLIPGCSPGERLQQVLLGQHRPAEQTPEQSQEGTPGRALSGCAWGGAGWCSSLEAAGHPGWVAGSAVQPRGSSYYRSDPSTRTPAALGNGAESVFLEVTESSLFGRERSTVTPLLPPPPAPTFPPFWVIWGLRLRSVGAGRPQAHQKSTQKTLAFFFGFVPTGGMNPQRWMSGRAAELPELRSKIKALKQCPEHSLTAVQLLEIMAKRQNTQARGN